MSESTADIEGPPPERRSFIRHPADIPLHVERAGDAGQQHLDSVSYGGLSFLSDTPHEPGTALHLRIDAFDPALDALARVAWCHAEDGGYRVGVTFDDPDVAFRSRLVEQVCAIEHYREELARRRGSPVSRDEAARLWIARYAARFPDP